MSDFEALLAQINAIGEEQDLLAKSLSPADDKKDDGAADETIAAADDKNPEDDDESEDKNMAKSMKIGDEMVQLVDADELIKSMASFDNRLGVQEKAVSGALESMVNMIKTQATMIKSLHDTVQKMSGQPMRKSIITVNERRSVADQGQDAPARPQPAEIMAKSLSALESGKLTGIEAARIEQYVQSGLAVPPDLLKKLS